MDSQKGNSLKMDCEHMNQSLRWKFKTWVPIVKPFPIRTFPKRLTTKIRKLAIYGFHLGFSAMGIRGAKVVGSTRSRSSLLKLNRSSPLGIKGKVIQIPKDEVIFRSLRFFGMWEIEECLFLSDALKRVASKTKVAFLDFGANTGMVTLQTLGLAQTNAVVIMVEPLPSHVVCIDFNIADLRKTNAVHLYPFALGKINGKAKIFTENKNYGNTSLISNITPREDSIVSEITIRKTEDFVEEVLRGYSDYVLKSDLQGYDAVVLASIPKDIYDRTEAAVVEIWALDGIDPSDVLQCLDLWGSFSQMSWSFDPTTKIYRAEVADFWLNKTGESRNLFMVR